MSTDFWFARKILINLCLASFPCLYVEISHYFVFSCLGMHPLQLLVASTTAKTKYNHRSRVQFRDLQLGGRRGPDSSVHQRSSRMVKVEEIIEGSSLGANAMKLLQALIYKSGNTGLFSKSLLAASLMRLIILILISALKYKVLKL